MSINLLPEEFKPKGYILDLSRTVRKFAMVVVVFFLVVGLLALGSYFLLSYRINASIANQEGLKNQIKTLEQTEQKIVLVQDRLTKIKEIKSKSSIVEEIGTLESVLEKVGENVAVSQVELKPSVAKVVVSAGSSINLTRFLGDLNSSNMYSRVVMESLDYSATDGYEMNLSISK